MAETHETITDIIAEKRALADRLEHETAVAKERKELIAHRTAQAVIDTMRREADRLEAALKRERGDCAKMREAVIGLRDRISMYYKSEWIPYDEWEGANDDADAALAAPPRNCDVGTVQEQDDGFRDFCAKYIGGTCTGCKLQDCGLAECALAWAQMPYEGGETK